MGGVCPIPKGLAVAMDEGVPWGESSVGGEA